MRAASPGRSRALSTSPRAIDDADAELVACRRSVSARPSDMPTLGSSVEPTGSPSRTSVQRHRGVEQRAAVQRRDPQAGGRAVGPRVDEVAVEVARLVDPQHGLPHRAARRAGR